MCVAFGHSIMPVGTARYEVNINAMCQCSMNREYIISMYSQYKYRSRWSHDGVLDSRSEIMMICIAGIPGNKASFCEIPPTGWVRGAYNAIDSH